MDYKAFGRRLRERRIQQEITIAEMSRILHFSPQHLGNIEHGHAHPSVELLVDYSNVLDVSVDYLLQDSLYHCSYDLNKPTLEILYFLAERQIGIVELRRMIEKYL